MRATYPDTPITLFTDDVFDAGPLAKKYNVNVFRRADVKDPFLRETNTGWGLPKMTMFWESPYERFLYLDADTILWGDVVGKHLQPMDWDVCVDVGDVEGRPWTPGVGSDEWTDKEYFNTKIMPQALPDFPWRKYAPIFFCTGTFGVRRGVFSIDEYKEVLNLRENVPGLFPIGEMPLLNVMIFRAAEAGRIKLKRTHFQMLCDYSNVEMLKKRYRIVGGMPQIDPNDQMVLHFTQPKPLMNSDGFNAPFVHYRKKAYKDSHTLTKPFARPMLTVEETEWRATRWWRYHGHRFHKLLGPLIAPIRKRYRGGR